jgi:hypothetical protein
MNTFVLNAPANRSEVTAITSTLRTCGTVRSRSIIIVGIAGQLARIIQPLGIGPHPHDVVLRAAAGCRHTIFMALVICCVLLTD